MLDGFRAHPFRARRRDFPDEVPLHEAAAGFRTEAAVVVRDGLLEEREILRTPASPGGVAWFGTIPAVEAGVPVQDLVACRGAPARRLPDIIAREGRPADPAASPTAP